MPAPHDLQDEAASCCDYVEGLAPEIVRRIADATNAAEATANVTDFVVSLRQAIDAA